MNVSGNTVQCLSRPEVDAAPKAGPKRKRNAYCRATGVGGSPCGRWQWRRTPGGIDGVDAKGLRPHPHLLQ